MPFNLKDIADQLNNIQGSGNDKQESARLLERLHDLQSLLQDVKELENAGCFSIVLEKIPAKLAKKVSNSVKIPVIGIGAGVDVDGQVLVLHDMLGMTHEFNPRFLRRYLNLSKDIDDAVKAYVDDVKSKKFPNEKEQY